MIAFKDWMFSGTAIKAIEARRIKISGWLEKLEKFKQTGEIT